MSQTSMATVSSSAAFTTSNDHERINIESIKVLIMSINQQLQGFLEDPEARKSVQVRCTSELEIQKQEFFEFSEHSILSNLYWGILSVEAAIQSKNPEDRITRLKNSEKKLQVPALLSENGKTGGIQNRFLICSSYFYLSLVRNLQEDEWQATLHFLQAVLVFPLLVRTEFVPKIWEHVFVPQILCEDQGKIELREMNLKFLDEFCNGGIDEVIKKQARRYKDWLMYYQVMSYGETSQRNSGRLVGHSKSKCLMNERPTSTKYLESVEAKNVFPKIHNEMKLDTQDKQNNNENGAILEWQDEVCKKDREVKLGTKNLQDMLEESQSPTSLYSQSDFAGGSDSEAEMDDSGSSTRIKRKEAENTELEISDWGLPATHSIRTPNYIEKTSVEANRYPTCDEAYERNTSYLFSSTNLSSVSDLSISERKNINPDTFDYCHVEKEKKSFRLFDELASKILKEYPLTHIDRQRNSPKIGKESSGEKSLGEVSLPHEEDLDMEILGIFEKTVSTLYLSAEKCGEDDEDLELTIWEMLNVKSGAKCELLKDVILDQLVTAISTSKEERIIRASVSILTTLISENLTIIEEIKKKGLRLNDLVNVLKRNVYEATTLIYLTNPSHEEMKTLDLLPILLDVACSSNSYKGGFVSHCLTPAASSLLLIQVLISGCDVDMNNAYLAEIGSSEVLARLVKVANDNSNIKEIISLAPIFVKCIQFDGKCRRFLSRFVSINPFFHALRSQETHEKFSVIQFLHEILCIPRSSAISLLHQIQQVDNVNIMQILMSCIKQSEPEYKVMAANLLLQLDMAANLLLQLDMLEDSSDIKTFREEALDIILEAIISDQESSSTCILSTHILSNLGGTYAWTGEPYTAAHMVIKAGLTSFHHRNMIRNFDWSDQCLQDSSIDPWCSKMARRMIELGEPLFRALEKGLKSKIKSVARDCLIAISWIGCEIAARGPNNLRYSACEILLSGLEKFLHPGSELEVRLLACLSMYNYTSCKGLNKIVECSEGVRESLRRLSNITWMAEELLKVTDYFLHTKSRTSCVHTQILEMGPSCSSAATALIYYKGQLLSGHSDGSIKVWEIKGQTAKLLWDIKEHKKAVTCFALYEPDGSLLSGSDDKTIRVWKLVQRKLESIEVIRTTEPIQRIDTNSQLIFLITPSHGLKVFDATRTTKIICKNKRIKSITVVQRKIYLGCTDSSIQEVDMITDQEREIRSPSKSWLQQNKPISSMIEYKSWLYAASSIVEGSNLKEWRRHSKPNMTISVGKGTNVQIMGVVEDFIYLNCSSSPSILQIWLRGTQQKVGRLSAGSKITSLLTANDIVICGTENGLIKGWIPF